MAWTIEYARDAKKALARLDKPVARPIADYLDNLAELDDPRVRAKPMKGAFAGLWRYHIGDYRVICDVYDDELVILALELGHRSSVYDD